MATTRSFQNMLNDHLANDLLVEEWQKRDYVWSKITKDNSWLGADSDNSTGYVVPFVGAVASSGGFGGITAAADIAAETTVRGLISTQKEFWMSLKFNHTDIVQHGEVSERNFLRILPDQIDRAMAFCKNVISSVLLNGPVIATATGDGQAGGTIVVNRVDKFQIGMKVVLDDDDTADGVYYVTAININTNTLTLSATRGGSAANLSAYTVAQNAKLYFVDESSGSPTASLVNSSAFLSFKNLLLSAANGGGTSIHGQTKTAYPYLQAINVDGSAVTAVNIMEKIFDALTTVRLYGKGMPTDVIMSYKNFGSCLKVIETSKGPYNVQSDSKTSQYGWTELEIGSVKGRITLVAVPECDDSEIYFIDWRAWCFASNGGFKKRKAPDGKEFYELRTDYTGYSYIVDVALYGELVCKIPSYNGVLYGISY